MNGIVKRGYPVARLPEDLLAGLDADATASVVVMPEVPAGGFRSIGEARDHLRRLTGGRADRFGSDKDVVRYVRAVRDGEDLTPWLGKPSTSTPTS